MIIYIHGFASSGLGAKARIVRNYFKERAISPSLPYIPELAIDSLRQLVERFRQYEPVYLIGSSLGGFYAIHLAEIYGLKAVLINPSIEPYKTLSQTGFVTHFHDLTKFEWSAQHIATLKSMKNDRIMHPENYLLMLQTGDDVLDYRVAKERFTGSKMIIEKGGSHAFDGFENHLKTIEEFLTDSSV